MEEEERQFKEERGSGNIFFCSSRRLNTTKTHRQRDGCGKSRRLGGYSESLHHVTEFMFRFNMQEFPL